MRKERPNPLASKMKQLERLRQLRDATKTTRYDEQIKALSDEVRAANFDSSLLLDRSIRKTR